MLLLVWLLIEPDADAFRPLLTEFQDWPWEGDLNTLDHGEDVEVVTWTPYGAPIPVADRLVCRHDMCEELLDRDSEQWSALVGRAVEIVGEAISSGDSTETPTMLKPVQREGLKAPPEWIRISDAERVCGINRGIIQRAADAGKIEDNGQNGLKRRIRAGSFFQWICARISNDPEGEREESMAEVERKMRDAGFK